MGDLLEKARVDALQSVVRSREASNCGKSGSSEQPSFTYRGRIREEAIRAFMMASKLASSVWQNKCYPMGDTWYLFVGKEFYVGLYSEKPISIHACSSPT